MKIMLAAVALLSIIVCFGAIGCKRNSISSSAISEAEAISIAKDEASRRGWEDMEIESTQFTNGQWVIVIWRIPKTPGGHAEVLVSTDGSVQGFVPGL